MITTTYTLKGDKGTRLTVTVDANEHNVATATDLHIWSVSDTAPDVYVDALGYNGAEFVVGHCFDGGTQQGDTWAVALEDGDLTHAYMADQAVYVETFTTTAITHDYN